MSQNIHPTALIESDSIGARVSVGPYSIIRKGAIIHDGCCIGAHVEIGGTTTLGEDNQVYKGVCIGMPAQEYTQSQQAGVIIGKGNVFREYVTVHCGTSKDTQIGNNNYFMVYSHVAHDCLLGDRNTLANAVALGGWVVLEDHVFISAAAVLHQYVRVGRYAMIGGLARVVQDVAPFALVSPPNARLYSLNVVGLRKGGYGDDTIEELSRVYGVLFSRSLQFREALLCVRENLEKGLYVHAEQEIRQVLGFLDASVVSRRGVLRKVFE